MAENRIDILCLCTWREMGGAQKVAQMLTVGFRERGYDTALGYLFEGDPFQHDANDHFVVHRHAPRDIADWIRFGAAQRNIIKRLRPKVAYGFHPLANVVGALAVGGTGKFVSTQAWPSNKQSRWTNIAEGLLTRTPLIHRNIAVSNVVADTFRHRGIAYVKKTTVVHNDTPVLPELSESTGQCRERFGMFGDGQILGMLGRLHEQKNVELALRTLPMLPQAQLWLAGDGPLEQKLRGLAQELGIDARVHFLGRLGGIDVSRFLRAIDLLLLPSLYEGHPLTLLEAMSMDVPVLANDIPVMREAGGGRITYAPNEPAAWALSIRSFPSLQGPRARSQGITTGTMIDAYLAAAGLPPVKRGH